jgi:hypothetical protein
VNDPKLQGEEILAVLGEGNFGKVYEVFNYESKDRRVLKIFKEEKDYKTEKEAYKKIEEKLGEIKYKEKIFSTIAFDDKFCKIYFEPGECSLQIFSIERAR